MEFGELLASVRVSPDAARIAWSPDGSRVAVASSFGRRVSMIEASTGLISWAKECAGEHALVFSPDGRRLAIAGSGSSDATTRVLDAGSGDPVWSLGGGFPLGLRYSPDGSLLAITFDSRRLLADARTGAIRFTLSDLPAHAPNPGAFASGSPRFAVAHGVRLSLFDTTTGRAVWDIGTGEDAGGGALVAFTEDESHLVVLTRSGNLLTVESGTGMVTARARLAGVGASFIVRDFPAAFSPDIRRLAYTVGNVLEVFLTRDGNRVHPGVPTVTLGARSRVAFGPAGQLVATSSAGDQPGVLVQDVATGAIVWRDATAAVSAVGFDPAGSRLAVGGPAFLRIHQVDPVMSRYAPGGEVTGIALAAEGIRLAAVAGAGKVTVFQAGDGEVLSEFETAGTVSAVAFDPDGGRYATGGADGVVRVRETISGRLRRFPHEGPVNALIFTGSGLLTCSSDRTVRLLSVTGDEIAETWPYRHTRPVNLLAASPDGRWAAFAGADHAVVVLDDGGREVCRVQHDQRVSALSFGALVASGSADGTVRLMDPRLGRQVAEVSHPASVTAVATSPDGSLLVTADLNGAVRVYDTTGDPPEQVQQVTYPDTVTGLVFHPADRRLAVIAETSSVVRIIDPLDGTEAVRLPHPAPVQRLTFSRNGELLATACADDVVRIFPGSWA